MNRSWFYVYRNVQVMLVMSVGLVNGRIIFVSICNWLVLLMWVDFFSLMGMVLKQLQSIQMLNGRVNVVVGMIMARYVLNSLSWLMMLNSFMMRIMGVNIWMMRMVSRNVCLFMKLFCVQEYVVGIVSRSVRMMVLSEMMKLLVIQRSMLVCVQTFMYVLRDSWDGMSVVGVENIFDFGLNVLENIVQNGNIIILSRVMSMLQILIWCSLFLLWFVIVIVFYFCGCRF